MGHNRQELLECGARGPSRPGPRQTPDHLRGRLPRQSAFPRILHPAGPFRPFSGPQRSHLLQRAACPTAPAEASFGAVSFLHRFGSSLNPHFHYHRCVCVLDGIFQRVEDDTDPNSANPESSLRFHEATALTHELLEGLQHTIRRRVLRHCARHGLLEPHETENMLAWEHGGGFSLDGSVRIEATDRAGLERPIRYCARGPFALERLHLVDGRSDQILYVLPESDPAGRTALRLSALEFLDRLATILPPPRIHRHRYHGVFAPNAPLRPLVTARARENALAAQLPGPSLPIPKTSWVPPPASEAPAPQTIDAAPSRPSRWAALLARVFEVFPLVCPTCQTPLTFIAFASPNNPPPLPLRRAPLRSGSHRSRAHHPNPRPHL